MENMAKNGKQHKVSLSSLVVEFNREEDGCWIAEIPKLPGVMACGVTKQEALRHVYAIHSKRKSIALSVVRGVSCARPTHSRIL